MVLSVNYLCLTLCSGALGCHGSQTQKPYSFHFTFHTVELSSITAGTHVKAASTESRQSVEEQSTSSGVKRICICNEYNASPTLSLEQESVQG